MKTSSKRKDARTKTLYAIQHQQVKKEKISFEMFKELASSIKINRQSDFGLGRLGSWDLDVAYPFEERILTLIEIAVFYKRDRIISHLILAGASPLQSPFLSEHVKKVEAWLWKTNGAAAVFATIIGVNLRLNCKVAKCDKCQKEKDVGYSIPCNHAICQECYWSNVGTFGIYDDPTCPCCLQLLCIEKGENFEEEHGLDLKTPLRTLSLQTKYKFDTMADEIIFEKKRPFRALPNWVVCAMYLGTSKQQRSQVLLLAAADGNLKRVEATIRKGVDLNAQNEYGQTALFIACWRRDFQMVETLLESGTSMMVSDYAGTFPEDVMHPMVDFNGLTHSCGEMSVLLPNDTSKSFLFDGWFTDLFLEKLKGVCERLPLVPASKETCNDRKYFCDSLGWVSHAFTEVLSAASVHSSTQPQMRFLLYQHHGHVPHHTDLSKTYQDQSSTHTFILYLNDCENGGETRFLSSMCSKEEKKVLAIVKPKLGRMVVFPHQTVHEGLPVVETKILLRGEIVIQ